MIPINPKKPGDVRRSRWEEARLREQIDQIGRGSLSDGSIDSSGVNSIPPGREWFFAKITGGTGSGLNYSYTWQEQRQLAENVFEDNTVGLVGTETYYPAYELQNSPDVPPGSIVRMWQSDHGDFYNFEQLGTAEGDGTHYALAYTENLAGTLSLASGTFTWIPATSTIAMYLDGVSPTIGDRILHNRLREDIGHAMNGVLVFTDLSDLNAIKLIRATDYDSAEEIIPGSKVVVTGGQNFHDKTFILRNDGEPVINTDRLIFDLHAEKRDIGWGTLDLVLNNNLTLPDTWSQYLCDIDRTVELTPYIPKILTISEVAERKRRVLWNSIPELSSATSTPSNDNDRPIIVKGNVNVGTTLALTSNHADLILSQSGVLFMDYDETANPESSDPGGWRLAAISEPAVQTMTFGLAPGEVQIEPYFPRVKLVPSDSGLTITAVVTGTVPTGTKAYPVAGRMTFYNGSSFALIMAHQGSGATPDKLICPDEVNYTLPAYGSVDAERIEDGLGHRLIAGSAVSVPYYPPGGTLTLAMALTTKDHDPNTFTLANTGTMSFESSIVSLTNPSGTVAQVDFRRATVAAAGVVSAGPTQQHLGSGVKSVDTLGIAVAGTSPELMAQGSSSVGHGVLMFQGSAADPVTNWAHVAHRGIFFNDTFSLSPDRGYVGPMPVGTTGLLESEGSDGDVWIFTNPGTFRFSDTSLTIRDYDDNARTCGLYLSGKDNGNYPYSIALDGIANDRTKLAMRSKKTGNVDFTLDLKCAEGDSLGLYLSTFNRIAYYSHKDFWIESTTSLAAYANGQLEVKSLNDDVPWIAAVQMGLGGDDDTFTMIESCGIKFTDQPDKRTDYGTIYGPTIYAHQYKLFGGTPIDTWELGHRFTEKGQVGGWDGTYNEVSGAGTVGQILTRSNDHASGLVWADPAGGSLGLTVYDHDDRETTFTGINKMSFENDIVNLSLPVAGEVWVDFERAAYTIAGVISSGPESQHLGSGIKSVDTLGLQNVPAEGIKELLSPQQASTDEHGVLFYKTSPGSGNWANIGIHGIFFDDSITLLPTKYIGTRGINTSGSLSEGSGLTILSDPGLLRLNGTSLLLSDVDRAGGASFTIQAPSASNPVGVTLGISPDVGWSLEGEAAIATGGGTLTLECLTGPGGSPGVSGLYITQAISGTSRTAHYAETELEIVDPTGRVVAAPRSIIVESDEGTDPFVRVSLDDGDDVVQTNLLHDCLSLPEVADPTALSVVGPGCAISIYGGHLWITSTIADAWRASIPPPPGGDGTWNLQLATVSGVNTYSWV